MIITSVFSLILIILVSSALGSFLPSSPPLPLFRISPAARMCTWSQIGISFLLLPYYSTALILSQYLCRIKLFKDSSNCDSYTVCLFYQLRQHLFTLFHVPL